MICTEKLLEGNELRYESENINFTLALTKYAFLRFHRGLAGTGASVATSGAARGGAGVDPLSVRSPALA